MNKCWLTSIAVFMTTLSSAQLEDLSIAPDFNLFDINGKQHHLYSYLSQGKTVILNFSPAWCQECWTYHKTNALKDFYTLYGPTGTNSVTVIFVEKDEVMGLADLHGQTTASAGNWVDGTPYPIIDSSVINVDYQPDALPTIYGIYPNKLLFNLGRQTTDELFEFLDGYQGSPPGPDTMIKVDVVETMSPSCNNFSDGKIDISVDGPGTKYSYAWTNGDTTQDISNLLSGIYRCTISDNLGNVHIIDPIELRNPDTLAIEFLKNTPTTPTSNNGSLIASVGGGTPPYEYLWDNGSTSFELGNLPEGTYMLLVRDANGCSASDSVELKVPECSVVVSINVEPTSCDEDPDGEVNILIDGATQPVTFEWNNGASTQSLINVPSGGYELTVTDAIGCSAIVGATVDIRDDVNPVAQIRKGPITFYLNPEGMVEVRPGQIDSGSYDNCGILDMQLEQQLFTCEDLGRNFVRFTVIDNNLNLHSRDAEILILDTLQPYFQCTEDITVASCDGVVHYPIPEVVDNCPSGSVLRFEGLGSGADFPLGSSTEKYSYVAGNGTRLECSFTINVTDRISADVTSTDVSCQGATDGMARVNIEGAGTYDYLWSDGQTAQTAVGLAVGTYGVTVSSDSSCTFEKTVFIGEPSELFIRLDSIKLPDDDYNVYVSVFGGTPPYRFSWINSEGESLTNTEDAQDLPQDSYKLEVLDAKNCMTSTTIIVDPSTSIEGAALPSVTISPNPSSRVVNVNFSGKEMSGRVVLQIRSVTGQLMHSQQMETSQTQQVDISTLNAGYYTLTISSTEWEVAKKLMILR